MREVIQSLLRSSLAKVQRIRSQMNLWGRRVELPFHTVLLSELVREVPEFYNTQALLEGGESDLEGARLLYSCRSFR